MSQNHYQVLGVPANAPAADIKRAYRRLVVQYHPDKHGGNPRYEEQFKAVSTAYRVLSDVGRRAQYDFQLARAARQAEEERRRQQSRPATEHVYGVPMPPAAPLRTRPPAAARERHYQPIAKQQGRFNRRDYLLSALLLAVLLLFVFSVKVTRDRLLIASRYQAGQLAFLTGKWRVAQEELDGVIELRPDHAGALRLRGEIQQLVNHNPAAARADYEAALLSETKPALAARLLYRLGRIQVELEEPTNAELSFTRALALDPTLAEAYLARGESRLLDLHEVKAALADLDQGLKRRQAAGRPVRWHSVQLRGMALTRLGRFEEARADYRQVLAAWPRDGRTHFLLGRLAQQTADSIAACEFFRRALDYGYQFARQAYQENCK